MSTKNVHDFIEKIRSDEAIQAKLMEITTKQREATLAAIVKVGAEAGFAFNADEYQTAIKEEAERQHAAGELDKQQLDAVVGGYSSGMCQSFA
ncbi:MAG: Nif11-like leader peptide family natural product precursor [Gemmataceae bacterium]